MSLIDPGTLAEFKAMTESVMPDTAVFLTPGGRVATEGGGWTDAPVVASAAIPCRTAAAEKPAEVAIADRLQEKGLEILVVPLGTPATANATVRVTSARSGLTTTYTIAGVVPLGSYSVDQRFLIRKVG